MNKTKMQETFYRIFGEGGDLIAAFAPGRVNLIGEHTDYNGGEVFPCALTIGTTAIARVRSDGMLHFYSDNFPDVGVMTSSLDDLIYTEEANWTNYPKGMIWAMKQNGYRLDQGLDFFLSGNIPAGAGLSSSASVEVVTGVILREVLKRTRGLGEDLTNQDLALMGKQVENDYCGLNSGIMDQFVIAMGKEDCAIRLNTADLSYAYAPLHMEGVQIVIGNTNKPHKLGDSAYNTRREECEKALRILQEKTQISHLCELTPEAFEAVQDALTEDVLLRRARHAVTENDRVARAVTALEAGEVETFGKLMNEAHASIRDDFEASCLELDTLVDLSQNCIGCLGSRMTGGGWGGCNVSLVRTDAVEAFCKTVGDGYRQAIGYDATFYIVEAGEGARLLSLD